MLRIICILLILFLSLSENYVLYIWIKSVNIFEVLMFVLNV